MLSIHGAYTFIMRLISLMNKRKSAKFYQLTGHWQTPMRNFSYMWKENVFHLFIQYFFCLSLCPLSASQTTIFLLLFRCIDAVTVLWNLENPEHCLFIRVYWVLSGLLSTYIQEKTLSFFYSLLFHIRNLINKYSAVKFIMIKSS